MPIIPPKSNRKNSWDYDKELYKQRNQVERLFRRIKRFRRRNGNGKNPDGQGFKREDFFAYFAQKYYSSLDRLDRRNGAKCRLLIATGCGIIFPQYKPINRSFRKKVISLEKNITQV